MTKQRSRSQWGHQDNFHLFINNLNEAVSPSALEDKLNRLFSRYGKVLEAQAKISRDGKYCFAFITYRKGSNVQKAVDALNGCLVYGKPMIVQFSDESKKRKERFTFTRGCYKCGEEGHFARDCASSIELIRSKQRQLQDEQDKKRRQNQSRFNSQEKYPQRSNEKSKSKEENRSRNNFQKRNDTGNKKKYVLKSKNSPSSTSRSRSYSSSPSTSEENYKKRQMIVQRRNKCPDNRNEYPRDEKKRYYVEDERSREKMNQDKKIKRKSRRAVSSSSSSRSSS